MPHRRLHTAISNLVVVCLVASLSVEQVALATDNDAVPTPIILFDGKTLHGWVLMDGSPVNDGWEVVDGAIHLKAGRARAGSIRTIDTFDNFVLEFEWRVAAGGNSGVKYRLREAESKFG